MHSIGVPTPWLCVLAQRTPPVLMLRFGQLCSISVRGAPRSVLVLIGGGLALGHVMERSYLLQIMSSAVQVCPLEALAL
jgi:di/tricarboxylate transporter